VRWKAWALGRGAAGSAGPERRRPAPRAAVALAGGTVPRSCSVGARVTAVSRRGTHSYAR
jgi:hypothetical protein